MLLINKVTVSELNNYRKEFLECLNNNISNSIINKIIIYVDDPKHDIPKLSNKVNIYFKKTNSIFELIENGKRFCSEDIIIYSNPLCQFSSDIYRVNSEINSNIITDNSNYFIFHKNTFLSNVSDVNGIFPLNRKSINLNVIKKSTNKIKFESKSNEIGNQIPKISRETTIVRKRKVVEKKKFVKDLGNPKLLVKKGVTPKIESVDDKRIKRLDVVIVSVNYNDLLIVSLENNTKIFDNITVVTSQDDLLCHKICQRYGVNCVITDIMYEEDATFNKGKAINEGIKSLTNPDYILLIDSDIVVNNKIELNELDENTLYTSDRWICKSYNNFESWKSGKIEIEKIGRNEPDKGIGFFQLFNYSNSCIDKNQVYPIISNNAAWSDLIFRDKFRKREKVNNTIIHLGDPYKNWNGRVTNRFLSDDEFAKILERKSTFTICSFYFNYNNDWRQKRNFIKFLEQWKDYYDNMIVGIVDYGDIDFEIPCEKIIIEGDVNKRIWSKEILINKIVEKIDSDYILWIDGDIIYEDLTWLNNLDRVIGDNDFVQLFETINYLGENDEVLESHKSLASDKSNNVDHLLGKGFKPGGSWMTRTRILKSKPLFEKMLVGGGDTILAYALYCIENGWTLGKVKEGSEEIYELAKNWISGFGEKKVGYLPVNINHLYHGNLEDRNYNERYINLEKKENKIIVFTENIGDYDDLKPIKKFNNTRCIAFLDKDIQIEGWEVINIEKYPHISGLKNTKLICKYIRTHSQELLPKHDYSLHIDANMILNEDPNKIIKEIIESNVKLMSFKHYKRNSIYEEAIQCIKWKLDNEDRINKQIDKYKKNNIGDGLYECGFMLRKNSEDVRIFDEIWWGEIKEFSQRDQISFPYAIKTSGVSFSTFKVNNRMKSSYLSIKTDKSGNTHKKSRIFNNNICMVYEDSRIKWGSTKMRGSDISEILDCDMIPLSKSNSIKYKKIILLKLSDYKRAVELSKLNEVIVDMVDFNKEIHDLNIFKNFDFGIFTSKKQLSELSHIFKYPEKCKVILHHWDKRLESIKVKEKDHPKICYIGQPEKCYQYLTYNEIDYFTIDWFDFDEKLKKYEDYNIHFGIKPEKEENKIQPSTKISTASALGCPIIVNKSDQNIEILGIDYPYYCQPNDEDIKKMFNNVIKTFGKKNWTYALEKMKEVKELTKLENIVKNYLNL